MMLDGAWSLGALFCSLRLVFAWNQKTISYQIWPSFISMDGYMVVLEIYRHSYIHFIMSWYYISYFSFF